MCFEGIYKEYLPTRLVLLELVVSGPSILVFEGLVLWTERLKTGLNWTSVLRSGLVWSVFFFFFFFFSIFLFLDELQLQLVA